MKSGYDIIKAPILTEKSYDYIAHHIYTFEVAKSANKVEIAKAVEELFGVKVESVHTVNKLGKIWEGSAVVQGFPLVRNAMFYIMLNDLDLFETVYLRTLEWLEACARHLEESGVSLK